MQTSIKRAAFLTVAAASFAIGQTSVQVQRAELSVPFGSVSGKLVAVGDTIVFVDDEHPDQSFAVHRSNIKDANLQNGILILETDNPVRDRSGERTRFSIKVNDGDSGNSILSWAQSPARTTASRTAPSNAAALVDVPTPSFQVEHEHRFRGGCRGRLIANPNHLVFESVDEIDHSRQWDYADVKELKLKSAYNLEVQPFTGVQFEFRLIGQGMGTDQYRMLVDRVAQARSGR